MDSPTDAQLTLIKVPCEFCEVLDDGDKIRIERIPRHTKFKYTIWNRNGDRRLIPDEVIENARMIKEMREIQKKDDPIFITWQQAKPYMNYEPEQPVRVA